MKPQVGRAFWEVQIPRLRQHGYYITAMIICRKARVSCAWYYRLGLGKRHWKVGNWVMRAEALERLVKSGASDLTIARRYRVSGNTITNWLKRFRITRENYWTKEQVVQALTMPTLAQAAASLKCDHDAVVGIAARYKRQGTAHALFQKARREEQAHRPRNIITGRFERLTSFPPNLSLAVDDRVVRPVGDDSRQAVG